MLFFAHSGLRFLVLLAGFAALAYFAYAVATRRGDERTARILGASFAGLLDLQVVLGLIMVALGLFYGAMIGHIFMMIAAVAVVHGGLVMARTSPDPRRGMAIRLMAVLVSLVLVFGGIMAIGRSVFGSGAPTMVY